MVGFDFYPHKCTITRGSTLSASGKETPQVIYSDLACYLQQGSANTSGNWIQGENVVHLGDSSLEINQGDLIEVTLDEHSTYKARIKQVYPIEDEDFGGIELKLFETDADN